MYRRKLYLIATFSKHHYKLSLTSLRMNRTNINFLKRKKGALFTRETYFQTNSLKLNSSRVFKREKNFNKNW